MRSIKTTRLPRVYAVDGRTVSAACSHRPPPDAKKPTLRGVFACTVDRRGAADATRVFGKVGKLARVELLLPLLPAGEQVAPAAVEPLVKLGHEIERSLGQHLVGAEHSRWLSDDSRAGEDVVQMCAS